MIKSYQSYLSEIKRDDRDKAAEYDELYKYYDVQCNASTVSLSYLPHDNTTLVLHVAVI